MNNSPKGKRNGRLGNALIYFCVFGLAASSMLKFLHPAKVVGYMNFLGYEHGTFFLIAGLEFLTAILFLIPSTRSAGLLLVSSYFGGAISAHLANHPFVAGGPFLLFNANHHYLGTLPPTVFLASAWIGIWLRHPESRWSFGNQGQTRLNSDTTEDRPFGLTTRAPLLR